MRPLHYHRTLSVQSAPYPGEIPYPQAEILLLDLSRCRCWHLFGTALNRILLLGLVNGQCCLQRIHDAMDIGFAGFAGFGAVRQMGDTANVLLRWLPHAAAADTAGDTAAAAAGDSFLELEGTERKWESLAQWAVASDTAELVGTTVDCKLRRRVGDWAGLGV